METLLDMFIEEGIGKGLKIGIEKGLQQGRLNTSRELVIDAIEAKFGNVPEKILKKIYSINDVDNLKNLHRQIILTDSVEKLNRILEEM
ncbi:hypothetical protein [Sulfurihydrogenibium sp.]|uniref:hypothetical protein n=1 Tax=Sulfurihydrogenibium sp. TaxID=2053621 RepID=UPI00260BF1D9|nr:hypothetical protein [Sulfurihydrogenibium sp.]